MQALIGSDERRMSEKTAISTTKAQRREEILEAAYAEFAQKGYAGASMEAIARRARASKETLYAWFENKGMLFNTLVEQRLAGIGSRVIEAATRDASPANILPIIAEDLMRLALAAEPLTRGLAEAGNPTLGRIGETIGRERAGFVRYLNYCRDQGYIAFDDDPFELASLFVAMAEGEWTLRLGTGMLHEMTDEMVAAHARRVTRMFLRGLSPDGPRS
jgi:AcrR family transcriptional regulator